MAKDTAKLRGMSREDLDKEAEALRAEIWKLRLQFATGQLQDHNRVRRARRQLARVLTVRREQELGLRESR
jgi:large subunit ribosomal protein L29